MVYFISSLCIWATLLPFLYVGWPHGHSDQVLALGKRKPLGLGDDLTDIEMTYPLSLTTMGEFTSNRRERKKPKE
jgi:hypothetical protein